MKIKCEFIFKLNPDVMTASKAICTPKRTTKLNKISVTSPNSGKTFTFDLDLKNGNGKILDASLEIPISTTQTTTTTTQTKTPTDPQAKTTTAPQTTITTAPQTTTTTTTQTTTTTAPQTTTTTISQTTTATAVITDSNPASTVSIHFASNTSTSTISTASTSAPSLERLSLCLTLKSHCNDTGMAKWMNKNCAQVCQMDVNVVPSMKPKDISLRGLNRTFLGNVYIDGEPVCDDKWDILDAHVACHQLGLGPAIAATTNSFFGLAEGDFGLDNVECIGSENSILECEHSVRHNCEKNEAAGVICSRVNVKQGQVFLDNLPVCSTSWTESNSRVVCRQMGFSNGSLSDESNGTSPDSHHTMSFACSGLEQNLMACPMIDLNCTGLQAQVTCSGPMTVHLVGGENAASGNVYYKGGPVCDDNWDIEDGHVLCRELGFLSAKEITTGSYFGPAYREFTANDVRCNGYETGLEFCTKKEKLESYCGKNEAAGVFCHVVESEDFHHVSKRALPAVLAGAKSAASILGLGSQVSGLLEKSGVSKDDQKEILKAVLNEVANREKALDAERENLKKEVMESGNKATANVMNQALDALKLSDIEFGGKQRATIEVDQKKGYINDDGEFKQGGLSMSVGYESETGDVKQTESPPLKFSGGLGAALINSCFQTGDGLGDPCNAVVEQDVPCIDMLEGAANIGVGYDGRGDYTFNDRKKSLVQRKCGNKNFYQGEQVPDAMNVWGVYDSQCFGMTFRSLKEYQDYLTEFSGMGSQENLLKGSTFKFSVGINGLFGGGGKEHGREQMTSNSEQNQDETSNSVTHQSSKKQLNFKYTCDVKRYNVFMDEVKPEDLSPEFLQDYLALPWSVWGAGAAQKYSDFIQRWGTHYIRSAVLGGKLSIYRSSMVDKSVESTDWTEQTLKQTKRMFSKSSYSVANFKTGLFGLGSKGSIAHGSYETETGQTNSENSTQGGAKVKEENTFMVDNIDIEGGSPDAVAIVTEEYKSGFGGDLRSWLKSIPRWPKPYDFKFGSICDLLDINYRSLLTDAIQPCWNMPLNQRNNLTFYKFTVKNNETHEEEERERECYFSGVDDFEEKMKHKRQSLCQAIDVFIEDGPLTSKSETVPGGNKDCEIYSKPKDNIGKGIEYQSIVDSGKLYAVNFDLPHKIKGRISQFAKIQIKFEKRAKDPSRGFWYVVQPDGSINTRDISYNHGSGTINPDKPLISIYGVLFDFDDDIGTLYFSNETCWLNKQDAFSYFENDILCGNDVDWMYRPLAKVTEIDKSVQPSYHSCNIKWTHSRMFNPSKENGCIRFTAASEGPIYFSAAAVPSRPDSWYTVRISREDVTVYKGSERLKQETDDISAVGLGSFNIYQTYFVCLKYIPGKVSVSRRKRENAPRATMNIIYGKLAGDESLGDKIFSHGYLTAVDDDRPVVPYYYAFGSGESLVKIVDAQVSDMPSYSCSGDTVFVEGKGCRQACPLYEISNVNSQKLNWRCSKENGEVYNGNSTHVLADHSCQLLCPEHYLPHPYESTVCQHDGTWKNNQNLGCVKACPVLEKLIGKLKLSNIEPYNMLEQNLTNFKSNCFYVGEYGTHVLSKPKEGNYHFEDEYCQITCGSDASGFEYTASHDKLLCHNHTWVTETFQAATLACTAKPCQAIYKSSLVQNAEIDCSPSAIIDYDMKASYEYAEVDEVIASSITDMDINGPQFVIDGKLSEIKKYFLHTWNDPYSWVQLKLPDPRMVAGVEIFNRFDCCGDRLQNLEIRAGLVPLPAGTTGQSLLTNNERVGFFAGPGESGGKYTVMFASPRLVQFITLQLTSQNYLHLNEVKVIGIGGYYNEKTECRVTKCASNFFAPLNNSRTVCKDNAWDSELKCQLKQNPCEGTPPEVANAEIVCDDADRVNNGSAFFDGTTCSFACKSGYVPKPNNGNLQVQCNNQKWQTPHTCAKVIHGHWASWGAWGTCQRNCKTSRTRSCSNPAPANGGAGCYGSGIEYTGCQDGYCIDVLYLGRSKLVELPSFSWVAGCSVPTHPLNVPPYGYLYAVSGLVDGHIFICGGISKSTYQSSCYSLKGGTWIKQQGMLEKRWASAASQSYLGFLVTGGHGGADDKLLRSTEYFSNGKWQSGPELPLDMYFHCQVSFRSTVIVAGGMYRANRVYQLKSGLWSRLPDMAGGMYGHSCVVVGENLYAIGGKSVEILNLSTIQWTQGPKLPFKFSSGQAIVYRSTIYVVNNDGSVAKLNSADKWEEVTNVGEIGHWEVHPAPVVTTRIIGC